MTHMKPAQNTNVFSQHCSELNSTADIHQQGPNNTCSHTTRLTTPMYLNWLF